MRTNPLTLFALLSTVLAVLFVGYTIEGLAPSERLLDLFSVSCTVLVAWWVVSDARQAQRVPCFDFGFFTYLLLPWSIIWYCLWSRGAKGLWVLAGIVGLLAMPYLCAFAAEVTMIWFERFGEMWGTWRRGW